MTLASGRMIGPYEVVSLRGAGGMGEVYRALDTRLSRTVAIKILPPGLNTDEALRARFEREARAISALSHPNICALYDIGNDDGAEYLVMEYLEGETLAERLARGPLPSSLVLRYGVQITEALQHAHRAGITHRDLKPGNIMITSAGAKLLDFGLAKFIEPVARGISDLSASTALRPLTAEGAIVGTTSYMSPEQLQGRPLDHRTDIFSMGVILYEMAAGQRPFRGDSAASVIAAILSSDPIPIRSLQPNVAPALERIILTSLEKNPDERWQTAHDVARQLRWISESSLPAEQAAPSRPRRFSTALVILITALLAGILTWGVTRFLSPAHPKSERMSLEFALPPELEPSRSPDMNDFVISPDGRTIAFVAKSGRSTSLFLRGLDSFDVRKVEGTDDAVSPFWSSGSEWLGYSARGKLWKVRASGGVPPEAICDISPFGVHASWNGETILFAEFEGDRKEIYRVADAGGTPVKVTSLRPGEWKHCWPYLLPDGEHFLYVSFASGSPDRTLLLASFGSPKQSVLARNISFARMSGSDRLVYVRDGSLLAQRCDIARGVTVGEQTTIASDVAYFFMTGRADFDASPSGVVIYRTDTSTARLVMTDRKGIVTRTIDDKGLFYDHALSPDGKKAAVTVETRATGLMDIWIYDLARGVRDRFTSEPAIEVSPAWAPDGKSIVYSQGEGGVFPHLVRRSLSGSIPEELTPKGSFQFSANFSPDGESVFYANSAGAGNDIFRFSLKTRTTEPFLKTKFSEGSPAVSPDGKWLAYTSNVTGPYEVYIQSLLGGEPVRIRISSSGGRRPLWRGDSKELFYVSPDQTVMSAAASATGRWDDATLEQLFRFSGVVQDIDASSNGQSFLISDRKAGAADDLFHIVLGLP